MLKLLLVGGCGGDGKFDTAINLFFLSATNAAAAEIGINRRGSRPIAMLSMEVSDSRLERLPRRRSVSLNAAGVNGREGFRSDARASAMTADAGGGRGSNEYFDIMFCLRL